MKKSIALVAMAFGVTSAFAQDLTSKKGEPFLPEAGDYAIAVDANPFLNYVGNFFGKSNANVAPNWDWSTNNYTIWGKMFKDANTAYRAGINLGMGSVTSRNMVADILANQTASSITFPTAVPMVENKMKSSNTMVGLTAGIEKRRGKTRLQGFYGAEAGISFSSNKQKYTYGNALAATNAASTTVGVSGADNWGTGNISTTTAEGIQDATPGAAIRMTEMKSGAAITFGVRGFVGAEYFVAPKISIGGEFGWGLGLTMQGKSKTTWEGIGLSSAAGSTPTVGSATIDGAKQGTFTIGTDNKTGMFSGATGRLRLAFHF